TRGDDDALAALFEHIFGGKPAFKEKLDIGQAVKLAQSVVDHAAPSGKARKPGLETQPSAPFRSCIRQRHRVAALAQGLCAFKPGGSAADDQDAVIRALALYALGVPAAPPFLTRGGILRAADGHAVMPNGDADVATDGLPDLVLAPFGDLARQEGIGDRRPRRADQVEHPAADLREHGVRRGEAADPDHRLVRDALDEVDDRLMAALRRKTRGATV